MAARSRAVTLAPDYSPAWLQLAGLAFKAGQLDPAERHGFQYQSWFGFTLYAEGARGTLGRGGTYRVGGGEPATGFSLYIDPLVDALGDAPAGDLLFLPEDHDRDAAARLRAIGWRTLAALDGTEDAAGLGCTHRLVGREPQPV